MYFTLRVKYARVPRRDVAKWVFADKVPSEWQVGKNSVTSLSGNSTQASDINIERYIVSRVCGSSYGRGLG